MSEISLVRPAVDLKESFLEALAEFQAEGLPWMMDLKAAELEQDFEGFLTGLLTKKTSGPMPVDQTELWAVFDGDYVGRIAIRHELNADLRVMGGHIGYDTRPSFRGRGIASAMLRLALPHARDIGLREVLLTCNDANIASIKVIEKNGGVLKEIKRLGNDGPLKRYYWITL